MEGTFTQIDWLPLWRDISIAIAWIAVVVFIISGIDDLFYDFTGYIWRMKRRWQFRKRERLTLAKLTAREEQRVAIFVPAWQEGEVIANMVQGILERVEYRNYNIFVGTYPNDAATQQAVDALAAQYPRIVKVVTERPGPTTKADCLNTLYRAMKAYEQQHGVNFDIMVMHDAEDVVHPYSLLLYNYLIPRVDIVQLPILPLPVKHTQWVHWSYADEFAEQHMKDMIVREVSHGFVPFAGVGTGFSRRALAVMEALYGETLFNEQTLTEDYNMGKKAHDAGLKVVFVEALLGDDESPWYRPLARRPHFIANWSFFPRHFGRAVRQKTRWITGIALQEWQHTGWQGKPLVKENLARDRKIFLSAVTALLAYVVFAYFIVYELGRRGVIDLQLLPIIHKGTLLYTLVLITTGLMLFRMLQRIVFTTMVYGLWAGLLGIPRIFAANVLNGYAAFRSLAIYMQTRAKQAAFRWDKTEHMEGVGALPATSSALPKPRPVTRMAMEGLQALLQSTTEADVLRGLEVIPREVFGEERANLVHQLQQLSRSEAYQIRARVARAVGYLHWPELGPLVVRLLSDPEWVVRGNAGKALIKFAVFPQLLREVLLTEDQYAHQAALHAVEQDDHAIHDLVAWLDTAELAPVREIVLRESPLAQRLHDTRPTPPVHTDTPVGAGAV